ncbi:DUF1934 family protein [Pediococcus pentosaceus]|jgi:Uncharacterized protein conserved in bacteria|uniref:DUF1934 domain-containing protein n=1 Tax=Pediococcus pentosaceus TaxID=1255 RepID=A0ABD7X4V7_PEDPE|nr:DUF1934 domain-containing protein [Pediococcus pentosaceus]AXR44025.1 DUF1934 domain-containing protein [Pediococcus pentosaceus]KAF0394292.1 DUF1934 family protein [Pediococcus pentosaceus]KAF0434508.1 DUF1934 family protein [Pediococcus pentosaceus]KAF0442851.1 DUF1934 family protein [Pediococcus pentosaceus]KAF0519539.1 DUF1934 family protein [Pediococcus pentosaceus]
MAGLNNGIPIEIHLETFIEQEGEKTHLAFDEPGQIFQMGDSLYLRYQEKNEETGKKSPVTMKIDGDGNVLLTRSSESEMRLRFANGKRIEARYRTPYGLFPIETVTPFLEIELQEGPLAGRVNIDYQLFAGEQLIGNYKIRLQFTA